VRKLILSLGLGTVIVLGIICVFFFYSNQGNCFGSIYFTLMAAICVSERSGNKTLSLVAGTISAAMGSTIIYVLTRNWFLFEWGKLYRDWWTAGIEIKTFRIVLFLIIAPGTIIAIITFLWYLFKRLKEYSEILELIL